jgi:hypothetical protein
MNKYDLEHVTAEHPLMTKDEWQAIYEKAWRTYYTWEHMEVLLKRALVSGISLARLADMIFQFYGSYFYEKLHPLQTGLIRRKVRIQRRSSMPRVNPLLFYPMRFKEILTTYIPGLRFQSKLHKMRKRIQSDPQAKFYSDLAIAPLQEMEQENLQMFQSRESSRAALAKAKEKQARATASPRRLSA